LSSGQRDANNEGKNHFKRSSWIILGAVTLVVIASLVPLAFPALITSYANPKNNPENFCITPIQINPFEPGILAVPLTAVDSLTILLLIFAAKKRMPILVMKKTSRLLEFEISKKTALVIVLALVTGLVVFTAGQLFQDEKWEDYQLVKARMDTWSVNQIFTGFEPHADYLFLWLSFKLFGNYRIVPFIASIALLLLTYLVTAKMSGKRFAGIVSMGILLQSNTFLTYNSSATYPNFWILFYLLSLYAIHRTWSISAVSYLLSIGSKALSVLFLPMAFFFIWRSNIATKRKLAVTISIVGLIVSAAVVVYHSGSDPYQMLARPGGFDWGYFWMGFTSFSYQLRFDYLIIFFTLPLAFALFIASKKSIMAEPIMVLIAGILLAAPLLTGITDQTNQPYRFIPLVVFFAVGVGVLFAKQEPVMASKKA
jgi:hypothetical protein